MLGPHARSRFVRFINIGLTAAAGGLGLMMGQSLMGHLWLDESLSDSEQAVVQNAGQGQGGERSNRPKQPLPDLSEFRIIVERDLFRSPYENAMTVPVTAVPPVPKAAPKPPLPPLTVTLSGTIVIGDERKAILKDGKQEDIYGVGQTVGGGVLIAVDDDRVVIARGDEQTPILLKSAMESAAAQVAVLSESGSMLPEKMAAANKKYKADSAVKPVLVTPAMARYPQFVRQPKGDQER